MSPAAPTLQDIVRKTTDFLAAKGVASARLDAELLMAHALGWTRMEVFTRFDYPLSENELERCRQLLRRRASGESVAAIIGKKGFYHHDWSVGPGVLIPRPETEMLVDLSLESAQRFFNAFPDGEGVFRFADLGCGTGCIGISIADDLLKRGRILEAELWESSPEAIHYAEMNRHQILKTEHLDRVRLNLGRVETEFAALTTKFELIVANPPYIAEQDHRVEEGVKQHEPHEALYADENGLGCLRRWSALAVPRLMVGGSLFFEIGDGQGGPIKAHFEKLGLAEVQVHRDLAGLERVVSGRKPYDSKEY
jgi:release factor glutamine methyltransferase